MPAELHNAPATTAIIHMLEADAKTKKWRATTLLKRLCTAQGALALLPLYVRSPAVTLTTCPIWRQALRAAGIRAREELPRQPQPAQWAEVEKALIAEPSLPVFVAILLAWL
jgi:hypothetical protein